MKKPTVARPRKETQNLKILIYGDTGVGKTFLAATAANMSDVFGRVLLIALDPGDLTIGSSPEIDNDNIDIAPVSSVREIEKWFDWLDTENIKDGKKEYGTVIFEGLTDMAEVALKESLEAAHKKDSSRPLYSPDIAHYKEQQMATTNTIRVFRDLDMHVIFTALAFQRKDDKTGTEYVRPHVPGKMVNTVGAYFDIIGYYFAERGKDEKPLEGNPRCLRVQPTDLIQAKDRSRRLGETIRNPNIPMLLDMMQNSEPGPMPKVDQRIYIKRAQIATKS